MARKVFLSFLGTNNYIPANYYIEGKEAIATISYVHEGKTYIRDF